MPSILLLNLKSKLAMSNKQFSISYAQFNEDLILDALLFDVKKGFYVDVGANYPTIDSVTKRFYDKNWRGINIEPIKSLWQELNKERPRDTNLQCGVGDTITTAVFREYPNIPGHSTFDKSQKLHHDEATKFVDYKVDIRTLKDIFEDQKVPHIHFLKVDVEGFEYQVVAGNDWKAFRPEVICIEANHVSQDWRPTLNKHDYRLFIADALNEYYVADEVWKERTTGFEERIVKLEYEALKWHQAKDWEREKAELEHLRPLVPTYQKQINLLNKQVEAYTRLVALTLKDRPLLSRIKRSAYGLTIDWWRYKNGRS
jgi:FkbM family methyltransferase